MLDVDLTDIHPDSITDAVDESTSLIDEGSSRHIESEVDLPRCSLPDVDRSLDTARELDIDV